MYPIEIRDNMFYIGERCLGDILHATIIGYGMVDGRIARYTLTCEGVPHEILIHVKPSTDIDKFFGITSGRPIWIWCSENRIKAEISNYARLGPVRRRGSK